MNAVNGKYMDDREVAKALSHDGSITRRGRPADKVIE
jgi:hypothetical protein